MTTIDTLVLGEELGIPMMDDTKWIAYYYQYGSYEGNGEAYCEAGGKFYEASLGHCSCYGPFDENEGTSWQETDRATIVMSCWGDGLRKQFREFIFPRIGETLPIGNSDSGND